MNFTDSPFTGVELLKVCVDVGEVHYILLCFTNWEGTLPALIFSSTLLQPGNRLICIETPLNLQGFLLHQLTLLEVQLTTWIGLKR